MSHYNKNTVIILYSNREDVTNIVVFDLGKFVKLVEESGKFDEEKTHQALVLSTVNYKADKESLKILKGILEKHYADRDIEAINLANTKSSAHNAFFSKQISSNIEVEFGYEMIPEYMIEKNKPEYKVVINRDDVIKNMETLTNSPYDSTKEIGISFKGHRFNLTRLRDEEEQSR